VWLVLLSRSKKHFLIFPRIKNFLILQRSWTLKRIVSIGASISAMYFRASYRFSLLGIHFSKWPGTFKNGLRSDLHCSRVTFGIARSSTVVEEVMRDDIDLRRVNEDSRVSIVCEMADGQRGVVGAREVDVVVFSTEMKQSVEQRAKKEDV
jgi:hypothetical protein